MTGFLVLAGGIVVPATTQDDRPRRTRIVLGPQLAPISGPIGFEGSDEARSPIVRAGGSRHQLSGGVALMWTFGPLAGVW